MDLLSFLFGFICGFGLIVLFGIITAWKEIKSKKELYERIRNKGK